MVCIELATLNIYLGLQRIQPDIFASLKKCRDEKEQGGAGAKKEAGIPGLSTGRNSHWWQCTRGAPQPSKAGH